MLLWITYGHLPRARKKKKKSTLSVEEMDDHDECEVDEGDEALHTCPSDEDFVESSDQLSESESDSQCCHLKCVYTALQRTD